MLAGGQIPVHKARDATVKAHQVQCSHYAVCAGLVMAACTLLAWQALHAHHDCPSGQSRVVVRFQPAAEKQHEDGSRPWSAPASKGSYRFPKIIHQTVKNKSHVSCQEQSLVSMWKKLNPGYTHKLYDDDDIQAFMQQHYPELVPMPFNHFLTGVERADLFRVLVLHKFGGVYADIDVWPLRPVDEWNADHNHDAALLLGLEYYYPDPAAGRTLPLQVTNWAMAAMPGHPLLGSMPSVIANSIQQQVFNWPGQQRRDKPTKMASFTGLGQQRSHRLCMTSSSKLEWA